MCIFNKSVLNVLSNFISHETILCNDKDPPWFNSRIKSLLQSKNKIFKNYRQNKSNLQLINKLNLFQERLRDLITISKNNYYKRMANKLNNLQRNSKAYWSLSKCYLNKKIPLIPPLFHENKFVTNFLEKVEFFNFFFFSKQCSLINNGSTLPTRMQYLTNNRLSSVTFSQGDIVKIIQNLDSGKAHGHDNISRRMLKICGSAIYKPLAIIFKQYVDTGVFLSEWKKGNIVAIHKKGDIQASENYHPVSLLPIFGKVLERLMFNEMFKVFMENELISSNQSGFKSVDFCVNQLVSITHEIYKSFDEGHEVRSVSPDISKAFNKVWHDGTIFKLTQNGIPGNLLKLLRDFLIERRQRVVLNGQASTWTNITARVP